MRRICLSLAMLACAVACPASGWAQKAQDLRKPAVKEWLTIGRDWHNSRYSTLT